MGKIKMDQEGLDRVAELFGGYCPAKDLEVEDSSTPEATPDIAAEDQTEIAALLEDPEDGELSEDELDQMLMETGFPGIIPPGAYLLRKRSLLIPLVDGDSGDTWQETVLLKSFDELHVLHRIDHRREVEDYSRDEKWCVIEVDGLIALACINDLTPEGADEVSK